MGKTEMVDKRTEDVMADEKQLCNLLMIFAEEVLCPPVFNIHINIPVCVCVSVCVEWTQHTEKTTIISGFCK